MTKSDAILLFIAYMAVASNVSGDVCPADGKVVHMCRANYAQIRIGPRQTSSVYLDSSNSVGHDGTCTCFIQAIIGPVTVTISAQHVSSQCQVFLDFPDSGLLLTCSGEKPSPVSQTIEPGTKSYITLSRANKDTSAEFCVHLQQTNTDGDGHLSLTCLQRDKNDQISKNVTESGPTTQIPPIPTSTQTAKSTPAQAETQHTTTQAGSQTTDSNTGTAPTDNVAVSDPSETISSSNPTTSVNVTTVPWAGNVTDSNTDTTSTPEVSVATTATKDHTSNTGTNSSVKGIGAIFSVESSVVVGILGVIILALILLGVCVYLRDRQGTRGRTHPNQEAQQQQGI